MGLAEGTRAHSCGQSSQEHCQNSSEATSHWKTQFQVPNCSRPEITQHSPSQDSAVKFVHGTLFYFFFGQREEFVLNHGKGRRGKARQGRGTLSKAGEPSPKQGVLVQGQERVDGG